MDKVKCELIPWAIENLTDDGFWPHDRFGYQPGSQQIVDKSKFGGYSWGLLLGLEGFSHVHDISSDNLQGVITKAYSYMKKNLLPGDINKWGHHSWATTAIAVKLYPQDFFPSGARYKTIQKNNS